MPLKSGAGQLRSLRALHLALGISYYKTFLPDKIVHPYAMDAGMLLVLSILMPYVISYFERPIQNLLENFDLIHEDMFIKEISLLCYSECISKTRQFLTKNLLWHP